MIPGNDPQPVRAFIITVTPAVRGDVWAVDQELLTARFGMAGPRIRDVEDASLRRRRFVPDRA
jgi:hypothetical protein